MLVLVVMVVVVVVVVVVATRLPTVSVRDLTEKGTGLEEKLYKERVMNSILH